MEKCYLSNFVEEVLLCIPCKFGPNPPKNNLRIDPQSTKSYLNVLFNGIYQSSWSQDEESNKEPK